VEAKRLRLGHVYEMFLIRIEKEYVMADKARFPQIPSTVWWGLRSLLQRSPNVTVDGRFLAVQLGVQEVAAKQYILELQSVGILSEDGKATAVAQKWRLDQTYSAAVEEILKSVYPEGLLAVAPPGEADRQKVVNWFMHEGFGQGAAGNKAATYMLIGSASPNEAPSRSATAKAEGKAAPSARPKATKPKSGPAVASLEAKAADRGPSKVASPISRTDGFPLNLNIQIHISADAGTEQIESIFSAMKRYLYDNQAP